MNDCVFCKIVSGELSSYKLYDDDKLLVFLSIDPVHYGHTLIIPKEHYTDYTDIPLDVVTSINKVGKEIFEKLNKKLNPTGIQLIQNNGVIQEIKHYHLHLVPYYCEGDHDKEKDKNGKENLDEVLKTIMQ